MCAIGVICQRAREKAAKGTAIASFFSLSCGSRSDPFVYKPLRVAHPDTWSVTLITHSQKRHTPARGYFTIAERVHTWGLFWWSLSGDKLRAAAFCARRGHATQVWTRAFLLTKVNDTLTPLKKGDKEKCVCLGELRSGTACELSHYGGGFEQNEIQIKLTNGKEVHRKILFFNFCKTSRIRVKKKCCSIFNFLNYFVYWFHDPSLIYENKFIKKAFYISWKMLRHIAHSNIKNKYCSYLLSIIYCKNIWAKTHFLQIFLHSGIMCAQYKRYAYTSFLYI